MPRGRRSGGLRTCTVARAHGTGKKTTGETSWKPKSRWSILVRRGGVLE
jgi:hypothetical protein